MKITNKQFRIKIQIQPKHSYKELYKLLQYLKSKKSKSSWDKSDIKTTKKLISENLVTIILEHKKTGINYSILINESVLNNKERLLKVIKHLSKLVIKGINDKRKKNRETQGIIKTYNGFVMNRKVGGVYLKPKSIFDALQYSPTYNPFTEKKPWSNERFVGIELEFNYIVTKNGKTNNQKIIGEALQKENLSRYCSIVRDHCGHEVRLLLPEKNYEELLKKIIKCLKDNGCQGTENCGAHVHIDMRDRNVKIAYKNLVRIQNIMYSLVPNNRRNNRFCMRNEYDNFDDYNKHEVESYTSGRGGNLSRYRYVNAAAYQKHKTLEVRLHHGTLEENELIGWIKLLLKTVDKTGEIGYSVERPAQLARALRLRGQDIKDLRERYLRFNKEQNSEGYVANTERELREIIDTITRESQEQMYTRFVRYSRGD